MTMDVVNGATSPTASVTLTIADDLPAPTTSSSHSVVVADQTVTLADDATLDRDIVVRWVASRQAPGCTRHTMRPAATDPAASDSAYGLLTIMPPPANEEKFPRDLVLLLDVSGSMDGRPLEHLKGIVKSLIKSLEDDDRLEMIAFSSDPKRYNQQPIHATAAERRKACADRSAERERRHGIDPGDQRGTTPAPQRRFASSRGRDGWTDRVRSFGGPLDSGWLPQRSRLHAVGQALEGT